MDKQNNRKHFFAKHTEYITRTLENRRPYNCQCELVILDAVDFKALKLKFEFRAAKGILLVRIPDSVIFF